MTVNQSFITRFCIAITKEWTRYAWKMSVPYLWCHDFLCCKIHTKLILTSWIHSETNFSHFVWSKNSVYGFPQCALRVYKNTLYLEFHENVLWIRYWGFGELAQMRHFVYKRDMVSWILNLFLFSVGLKKAVSLYNVLEWCLCPLNALYVSYSFWIRIFFYFRRRNYCSLDSITRILTVMDWNSIIQKNYWQCEICLILD